MLSHFSAIQHYIHFFSFLFCFVLEPYAALGRLDHAALIDLLEHSAISLAQLWAGSLACMTLPDKCFLELSFCGLIRSLLYINFSGAACCLTVSQSQTLNKLVRVWDRTDSNITVDSRKINIFQKEHPWEPFGLCQESLDRVLCQENNHMICFFCMIVICNVLVLGHMQNNSTLHIKYTEIQ